MMAFYRMMALMLANVDLSQSAGSFDDMEEVKSGYSKPKPERSKYLTTEECNG